MSFPQILEVQQTYLQTYIIGHICFFFHLTERRFLTLYFWRLGFGYFDSANQLRKYWKDKIIQFRPLIRKYQLRMDTSKVDFATQIKLILISLVKCDISGLSIFSVFTMGLGNPIESISHIYQLKSKANSAFLLHFGHELNMNRVIRCRSNMPCFVP